MSSRESDGPASIRYRTQLPGRAPVRGALPMTPSAQAWTGMLIRHDRHSALARRPDVAARSSMLVEVPRGEEEDGDAEAVVHAKRSRKAAPGGPHRPADGP